MADNKVPYFHNAPGVPVIEIGAREFKCTGSKAPYDHPHIYLGMGQEEEIVCPYCSTLFKHANDLGASDARPAEAGYASGEAV